MDSGGLAHRKSFAVEIVPRTPQRIFNPFSGRDQDVDFASFDSLHIPYVEIYRFGEFLLGNFPIGSFPANILAK